MDDVICNISANPHYCSRSQEELRWGDYRLKDPVLEQLHVHLEAGAAERMREDTVRKEMQQDEEALRTYNIALAAALKLPCLTEAEMDRRLEVCGGGSESAHFYMDNVDMYLKTNRPSKALSYAQRALHVMPGHAGAHIIAAKLLDGKDCEEVEFHLSSAKRLGAKEFDADSPDIDHYTAMLTKATKEADRKRTHVRAEKIKEMGNESLRLGDYP